MPSVTQRSPFSPPPVVRGRAREGVTHPSSDHNKSIKRKDLSAPSRLCAILLLLIFSAPISAQPTPSPNQSTIARAPDYRRQTFLLATIYCLTIIGISLWRSRWTFAAIVIVSLVVCILLALFTRLNNTPDASTRQTPLLLQN